MTKPIRKIGALLSLVLLLGGRAAAQEWEPAGSMPVPVAGGKAFCLDGKIYIVGGRPENGSPGDLVQIYDPASASWQESSRMPQGRSGFAAARRDGEILVLGGLVDSLHQAQRLLSWDLAQWRILGENRLFDRTDGSAAVLGDRLILIGGYPVPWSSSGTPVPAIAEYDLTEKRFVFIDSTSLPGEAPYNQLVAVHQSRLWLFGGVQFGISNKCYRYDPFDHSLVRIQPNLLQPRAGGEVVTTPDREIWLIGGYNESAAALNSVEIVNLDGGLLNIRSGPPLRHARRACMAAICGEWIYLFGGYDERGYIPAEVEKMALHPATAVNLDPAAVSSFRLIGSYPNPFNSRTIVSFTLPQSCEVKLEIYSIRGERMRVLLAQKMSAGEHQVIWDGTGVQNQVLPSGLYLCRLTAPAGIAVNKMTLIR